MSIGKVSTIALAGIALAACSAGSSTQEVPDLVGSWSGSIVSGARFGALNHDPAVTDPVFADPAKVWTLTIDQQDGAGLIGTWSTATKTERLVGAIRRDNVNVVLADEDNQFTAVLLSTDEMELCAQEGGAGKGGASIAVCYLMTRG